MEKAREKARAGRKYKGERKMVVTRVKPELHALAEQASRAQGFSTLSDYVGTVLAREIGREDLGPIVPKDPELPIAS